MKERSGMQNKRGGWPISRRGFLTGVGPGAVCVAATGHLFAAGQQKEATAVLEPGDMGRYAFVLVGTQAGYRKTFGSARHGAGRVMGHRQAKKAAEGRTIVRDLEDRDIIVKGATYHQLAVVRRGDSWKARVIFDL